VLRGSRPPGTRAARLLRHLQQPAGRLHRDAARVSDRAPRLPQLQRELLPHRATEVRNRPDPRRALGQLLGLGFRCQRQVPLYPQAVGNPLAGLLPPRHDEVDIVGTDRRYPQIFVSDRGWPVQDQLVDGASLVFQTFNRGPQRLDIELCDHRTWETNDQCPRFAVENGFDLDGPFRPQPEVNEHMGIDRRARIDAYASTRKAYLFLDGQPYGCADLPAGQMPPRP